VTGYGLDDQDSIPSSNSNFSLATMSRLALKPTHLLSSVQVASSIGTKQLEQKARHSPSQSAKVKNVFSLCLHGMVLNTEQL
jgi:hypothetical protein